MTTVLIPAKHPSARWAAVEEYETFKHDVVEKGLL